MRAPKLYALSSSKCLGFLFLLLLVCVVLQPIHATSQEEPNRSTALEEALGLPFSTRLSMRSQAGLAGMDRFYARACLLLHTLGDSIYGAQCTFRKAALHGLLLFGMGLASQLNGVGAEIMEDKWAVEPVETFGFMEALGGRYADVSNSIIETSNRDLVLTGKTLNFGARAKDALVLRLSEDGKPLWGKILGGWYWEEGNAIIESQDGGLVFVGDTFSYGVGYGDMLLTKLNQHGALLWSKTLGGRYWDFANAMVETKGGDLLLIGYTNSFGAGNFDLFLSRLSPNGTMRWSKTLGGSGWDIGHAIVETKGGDFVLAGTSQSFGAQSLEAWISRVSKTGDLLWSKTLGGPASEEAYGVVEMRNGDLVLVGTTRSFGPGWANVLVSKLSGNGTLLWSKALGGRFWDNGHAILETKAGHLVLTGFTSSFGNGWVNALVSKLHSNGSLLWSKTLYGRSWDSGSAILETTNGDLLVGGYTTSFGAGWMDVLVARLSKTKEMENCTTPAYLNLVDITDQVSFKDLPAQLRTADVLSKDITQTITTRTITPYIHLHAIHCFPYNQNLYLLCSAVVAISIGGILFHCANRHP